jgi:enamine deaminase RidA (YjgF/YER057c/UK114 family)
MPANLQIRSAKSPAATEIYISAAADRTADPQKQAREIFRGIRKTLRSKNAAILQERIFASPGVMEILRRERAAVFGDIDDGVAPAFLVGAETTPFPFAAVQVHAVINSKKPEVIKLDDVPCGRILRLPDYTILTLSQITAPQFATADEQARAMLEKALAALKKFNADFHSVPRTWMWLGDILSWYDDFNLVRNKFYTECGTIGPGTPHSMPASTGIGLAPAEGGKYAMDLLAVLQPSDSIEFFSAVGRQQCALEYGSAFSRASAAVTPAGRTVFVSGTASIDAEGESINIGDPAGQINTTIENVRAVLRDTNCSDNDVVQAVAYCKTLDVLEVFDGMKDRIAWPWITVVCDICRPELLFEIEATVMPR